MGMPRKPSPCGTVAAYKRQLRHKEKPCDACRSANRDSQKAKRESKAISHVEFAPSLMVAEPRSRLEALEQQREWLTGAMEVAATLEPKSIAAISRELRAVWAEIEELSRSEKTPADDLEIVAGGLNVVPLNADSA